MIPGIVALGASVSSLALTTVPWQETFTLASTTASFDLLGEQTKTVEEPFDTDTGQLTKTDRGVATTAVFDSSTLLVTTPGGGYSGTCVITGPDISMPLWWSEITMGALGSLASTTYSNICVGLAKDKDNGVFASWDADGSLIRVMVVVGGTVTFLSSTTLAYPGTGTKFAFSLVGNQVGVWYNSSGTWVRSRTVDVSAYWNFVTTTTSLTGWKPALMFEADAATTWRVSYMQAGTYAGVCFRDPVLVTNADGSPVDFAGKFRISATSADTDGDGINVVYEFDPSDYSFSMVGALMVVRGTTRYFDLNAHIIKNEDATWRVLMATWGNGFGGDIDVSHKNNVGDISSGAHILTGMASLSLPNVPNPATTGGSYDPYAVQLSNGDWLLAYAVTTRTNFVGENFYIAASQTSDFSSFTDRGSDSSRTVVEGPKITPVNGYPQIYAGGRGRQPVYSHSMAYLGDPVFSADLYNGTDTQPHVMLIPYDDLWIAVTFNNTKHYGSSNFTWGNALIYESERTKPYFRSLPSIVSNTGFYAETDTMTVVPGTSSTGTYTYQWYRDGVAISGETGTSYTLTATDVGTLITVVQTATNTLGSTDGTSAAVGPVGTPTYASDNRVTSAGDTRVTSATDTRVILTRIA